MNSSASRSRVPRSAPLGYAIDREALRLFVHARRRLTDKLSMDGLADRLGLSKATIFRAENGQRISAESLLALARWMAIDPYAFLIDPSRGRLRPLPKLPSAPTPGSSPGASPCPTCGRGDPGTGNQGRAA